MISGRCSSRRRLVASTTTVLCWSSDTNAGWIDVVEPSSGERHGVEMAIHDIERPTPGTLRATMSYEVGGHHFEQPFTAHDVGDQRLAEEAAAVGLTIDAVLDDHGVWVRLRPRQW